MAVSPQLTAPDLDRAGFRCSGAQALDDLSRCTGCRVEFSYEGRAGRGLLMAVGGGFAHLEPVTFEDGTPADSLHLPISLMGARRSNLAGVSFRLYWADTGLVLLLHPLQLR